MSRHFFLPLAILALVACDGEQPQPAPSEAPATPVPPPTGEVPGGGARQVKEETDTFLFEYSYPKAAGDLPELAAWLDSQLAERRSALAGDAARGREAARDTGFPYNKYSSGTAWEVVADLPGWLSLSAELSSYEGGAHPNYGYDTMVWDKAGKKAVEPITFFISPQALDEVLAPQLCAALDAERAKRRGMEKAEGSDDPFDACVKIDETNLLLGSSGGGHFNRIGVQIAPYLAGPYAEGNYEFTFPVTAELLATVKPEYREAFAARN